jgi:putative DNA primase/helicase
MRDQAEEIAKQALNIATAYHELDVEMLCMSDVVAKPVSWLWEGRIACGKITVVAGNPGLGKSQIMASLAAIVTTGRDWPDVENLVPSGNVIFLSAEDDPADTIKPRLIAAGADIPKCHVLSAIKTKGSEGKSGIRNFDLTKDIQRLEAVLERTGNVKLIIIDPISAYLGGTDSHNNADMRGILAPLSEMAARHDVAIILVTHFNKSKEQDMIGRVMGSIGLIAAARAGYAVVKDENKPEKRYFLPIKNNIGNDKDGFSFHIDTVSIETNIQTSMISWHADLVDANHIFNPEKATQKSGATAFLSDILSGGPKNANEIIAAGIEAGYSRSSLQRAAKKLNVVHDKLGMKTGWLWILPKISEDTEGAEGSMTF